MNVRPKRLILSPERMKMHYGEGTYALECEVIKPPSAEGRTVYVFLDDDDVTTLLLELRSLARVARMRPLGEAR